MEKSQRELTSLVESQSKQLIRYETRLKDVVSAYKGLLKEKEALESSLAILTTKKPDQALDSIQSEQRVNSNANDGKHAVKASTSAKHSLNRNAEGGELQLQIATVMNSLATLSAEKSKMEASFQADKKSMRYELKHKDDLIADLQEKQSAGAAQTKLEVEKVKSKLIIERHEWEKESNNQMSMVRELQKLLADERQLRDNLEMQLNDLKVKLSKELSGDCQYGDIKTELEQTKRKLKEYQQTQNKLSDAVDPSSETTLKQLQSEMTHLKQQHAAAIHSEQQRAHRAEERNRALAAMHEERVASLENRLAELSATVGSYDRLRQIDQESITKLKEKVVQVGSNNVSAEQKLQQFNITECPQLIATKYTDWDVNELINEILLLNNVLLLKNAKLETPVDISKIYNALVASNSTGKSNESNNCTEQCESLRRENQNYQTEIDRLQYSLDVQKSHIKTLQSKVEVLNRNIDEQEDELRNKNQEHKNDLRAERSKWKEVVANMETEFRTKQSELESQLQKQRERSLCLLEEKENEIKSLKASFDVFMVPAARASMVLKRSESSEYSETTGTTNRAKKSSVSSLPYVSNVLPGDPYDDLSDSCSTTKVATTTSSKESMHMLHYVHELSRKEVEISGLRKAKHLAEQTLRQALQDKAAAQEDLYDKIAMLEEQVDRLERCKSREGANLEYLKNVFLSYLLSNDLDGRRHMVNAIGAVLKFSPSELKAIENLF